MRHERERRVRGRDKGRGGMEEGGEKGMKEGGEEEIKEGRNEEIKRTCCISASVLGNVTH